MLKHPGMRDFAHLPKYNFQEKETLLYNIIDLTLPAHLYTTVRLMDAIFKYNIIKSYYTVQKKKTALMTCTTTNTDLSGHYCHLNTVGHRKISFP
jgi:hypothetical protein